MTCTPKRAGRTTRATSPWSSSPRAYTFPCFTSPAACTIISGVMTLSIPRLSCSPHRPQLPRLPHLPGTVHGAGSRASLSSSGYCGACCALVLAIDRKRTPSTKLPTPTSRDLRRSMASPPRKVTPITPGQVQDSEENLTPLLDDRFARSRIPRGQRPVKRILPRRDFVSQGACLRSCQTLLNTQRC